uniref:Uncharacterized protein n=1 Tax=Anguilla anguilla TaxID=7936 RepID=A0A0E9TCI7_ANGAN
MNITDCKCMKIKLDVRKTKLQMGESLVHH